jgi:hypothetical protein
MDNIDHVLIISSRLSPTKARAVARFHNALRHSGIPTATVEVGWRSPLGRAPWYRAVCRACKERGSDDATR